MLPLQHRVQNSTQAMVDKQQKQTYAMTTQRQKLCQQLFCLCIYCFSHLSSTNDKHCLSYSFLNVRICSLTLSAMTAN